MIKIHRELHMTNEDIFNHMKQTLRKLFSHRDMTLAASSIMAIHQD